MKRTLLAALSALLALACADRGVQPELTVYAAASLRDALEEVGLTYQARTGASLTFNFGSSGDLSRQLVAAGQADLFFSADEKELDRVQQAGLVEPGTRCSLLSNQLVVIEPADGPSVFVEPFAPAQLAKAELLSLADTNTVPAGKYAKAWLESRGVWKDVEGKVLPAIDVRAALAAVESGGARAGIVYKTDAARSKKVRVVFAVPMAEGPHISYPLAVIAKRPQGEAARALAAFLATDEALAVFEKQGFVPLGRTQ